MATGGSSDGTGDAAQGRVPVAVIILSGILIISVVGYAIFVTPSNDGFAELSIVPGCDGEPVQITNLTLEPGATNNFTVTVRNRESGHRRYTLVAQLEFVDENGTTVKATRVVQRWTADLGVDEEATRCLQVTPPERPERQHLAVYLYRGSVPTKPDPSTAERVVRVSENTTARAG